MNEMATRRYLLENYVRLLEVTRNCREDMHEPDEQGVRAFFYGYKLDNANGDRPEIYADLPAHSEMCVAIEQENAQGETQVEWFNLATLIALARKAYANE
jgi:hypothetical protein